MKKILLAINCLLTGILANAQSPSFEWAKNMGGFSGTAQGNSVAKDNADNLYITGYFAGRTDFDIGPGINNFNSLGGNDIFILKTDASSNLIWAIQVGGTSNENGIFITLDGSGNIYVTGNFSGTVDFNPGPGIFNLTAAGGSDAFILKLDAAGNFVWVKQVGGTSDDSGNSIALDVSGNIHIAGTFNGTADFDPGAGIYNLTSLGSEDVFILKLDVLGNFVWAKQTGGSSRDFGWSIALDGFGNVYTGGEFFNTVDFDPGPGVYNIAAWSWDAFVSKLDASGNFIWAKKWGGSAIDRVHSIVIDGSGFVYTTGSFFGTVDFDPGAGSYNLAGNSYDAFISKMDAAGNLIWAKNLGGSSSDAGNSIYLDVSGNIYTTGYFEGTADFDPGAGTFNLIAHATTYTSDDIFISKLDASGNFVWAKGMGGVSGEWGNSILTDGSDNVVVTGFFRLTADFDPDAGVYNLTTLGDINHNGFFITKINSSGNFVWAKNAGSGIGCFGNSVAVDVNGNVITTGYFFGKVDFDPGAGISYLITDSINQGDIFICKLNASGNFAWAKQIVSVTDTADEGRSVTTDGAGNIYITGCFRGIADFDPGAGTFNLTSSGSSDIFVCKLDPSGNFVWAKNFGGTGDEGSNSIQVDASGNVYTTGYFRGTTDFDPGLGTFNLTSAGSSFYDIFVCKLDASGNLSWAYRTGAGDYDVGNSIAVDGSGNVYTTGYFKGTVDFDPGSGTFNLIAAGNTDIFVTKTNTSGSFIWAKQLSGTSNESGLSIAVDAASNVYTTGYFNLTVDFDPGPSTFNLTSAGSQDIFISKLDASGNFVWAKQLGGNSVDVGNSIAVDSSGNVYTTGTFFGTADFDPGAGAFNLISVGGGQDIFISQLDASGSFVWAKQLGSNNTDYANSIVVDNSDNIYTTGNFYATADFDPDAGIFNLTPTGYPDMFVHKMSQCTFPAAIITPAGALTFCSGSSVILNANTGTGLSYQWKNNGTNISSATNSLYTAIAAGSYTVVVTNSCGSATSSSITVTVNALPSATVTPSGPTTFCSGGSVVLNAPIAASRSYQWKKGANLISGATLSSYTATTGGSYKVIVTNTVTGCSKTTGSPTVVTVNALPSATITPQGPTTFCAGGSVVLKANTGTGLTYKWKKGSNFISGATLLNYTATVGGTYKVEVTNSNGCSKLSAGVVVSVPCREGEIISLKNNLDFNVYPNPNAGEFTIKFSNKPASPIQIELTDELGKVVKRFETSDETVVIKESNLAMGIYCLSVKNKDFAVVKKIDIAR
jgi:hypothetical protein